MSSCVFMHAYVHCRNYGIWTYLYLICPFPLVLPWCCQVDSVIILTLIIIVISTFFVFTVHVHVDLCICLRLTLLFYNIQMHLAHPVLPSSSFPVWIVQLWLRNYGIAARSWHCGKYVADLVEKLSDMPVYYDFFGHCLAQWSLGGA